MTTFYLFAYYILDSQVSLSSSTSIKTGFIFFLTFCFIITPISGIMNYYCYYVMENWGKKSGENRNNVRKIYPNNHEKFSEQQS